MKTMKYLVSLLCIAFALGACTKDDGLNDKNAGKEKPTVELKLNSAEDDVVSFTMTASDNAAQMAYVVLEGSGNDVPVALNILVTEVSGAYAADAYNVDADNLSATAEFGSTPMETYQVFAAAITADGLVGDVAVLDVYADDTQAPQIMEAVYDANVLTIYYDELLKRGTGKVSYSYINGYTAQVGEELTLDESGIEVENNTLKITVPRIANGAGYLLSWQLGTVTDLTGNEAAKFTSGISAEGQIVGLYWFEDPVPFSINESYFNEIPEGYDWFAEDACISLTFPHEVYDMKVKDAVRVLYDESDGSHSLKAEYTISEDHKTVSVYLPKAPTGNFDVAIAAGAFCDGWGNTSLAFTPATYRYSNYLISIVGGTYLVNYFAGNEEYGPDSFPALIQVADNTTVYFSADWFNLFGGYALPTQLVGTVDYGTKTITFDGTWLYNGSQYPYSAFGLDTYYWDEAQTAFLVFWGGGDTGTDPIVMTFDDDGYITTTSYFDYSLYDSATSDYLGVVAAAEDGTTMTYVPEETETQRVNSVGIGRKSISLSHGNFKK